MKMKAILATAVAASLLAAPASADLVIPDLSYRTGPYAAGGTPFSDGYQDYLALLNARDGGIGGEEVRVVECETGYNTEKGVECYESTKGEGALVYQPLSTGITYQLIPKAEADNIPLHTLGYGRTSVKDGKTFNWAFNYPANYWDAASVIVNYLKDENQGDLKGKTIALLYHNSAYGKEPIPTLEKLAEAEGYELDLLAVDHPGQEQTSQWLQIRRSRPDYVLMWGWGVMNQVAIQEAANIRYPMENFIGNWWSGAEHDVGPAGKGANGYKSLNMTKVTREFPVLEEIETLVHDKGDAAGDGSNIGSVLYIRGMYAAMLTAEAIAKAQDIHGVADITPAMMRDGMEALEITKARMTELGMEGIGPEFSVSCENHGGPGLGIVQQWNADDETWSSLTGFIASDKSVTAPLVEASAKAYAEENDIKAGCL